MFTVNPLLYTLYVSLFSLEKDPKKCAYTTAVSRNAALTSILLEDQPFWRYRFSLNRTKPVLPEFSKINKDWNSPIVLTNHLN